jgi:hypothetical protein
MLELLKKIGVPATVSAVIAALVTIMPFLFKLDERYAKASELEQAITKVDKQMQALTVEVGRLAGIQQVLVTIAGQSAAREAAGPRPIMAEVPAPAPSPVPVAAAPAPRPESKPIPVESVALPKAPAPDATHAERKEALEKAKAAVEATQRNIESIKKY